MPFRNTPDRYGAVAKAFHWLTLLLLIGSFTIAYSMIDMRISPRKLVLYSWHKWVGVTVFLIVILRLAWRLRNRPPPLPGGMGQAQRRLAGLSHGLLYTILIVMPLTGWVMSSARNLPLVYLGLIEIPSPFGVNPALGDALKTVHYYLSLALLFFVGVHVLAALQHHFILRDDILRRMLPWPMRPTAKSSQSEEIQT
ncbi:MAG TPA: cytochrome b [Alphaproteobacteria bacterium]|nr:cytochrome b [Alphaproteobacteria bacterium]